MSVSSVTDSPNRRGNFWGSGQADNTVKKVLSEFILDFSQENLSHVGDGYFPPLVGFSNMLMFNFFPVRTMMHERNILYALNRRNDQKFANRISQHLEPKLLDDATDILTSASHLSIKRNVRWDNGEVDLIAYDSSCNVVLQIQAKSAIAPQGARMAQHLDSHTIRALEQLGSLMRTSTTYRDKLCTEVFGQPIANACWISAIMSRSGIGTSDAWSRLDNVVPLNPALLRGIMKQLGKDFSLDKLPGVAEELFDRLRTNINIQNKRSQFSLFGKVISFPTFDANQSAISEARLSLLS